MGTNRKDEFVCMVSFTNMAARQRIYTRPTMLKEVPGLWLNEDLTPFRERLNFKARTLFRDNIITRNWTFLGDIFIQLGEGEPLQVSSEGELRYVTNLAPDYVFPARPPLATPENNGVDYRKDPTPATST